MQGGRQSTIFRKRESAGLIKTECCKKGDLLLLKWLLEDSNYVTSEVLVASDVSTSLLTSCDRLGLHHNGTVHRRLRP
jgi:hypothetical protein